METKKGHPVASMRFRWQTYDKHNGTPYESEWEQIKQDAINIR